MTQGLHRFYGGDDLHFLTFSCYRRQPLFNHPVRCDLFLEILERVRRRYRLVVLGYVVMPEHVHLLVNEPQRENLSVVMQALKLGFVRSMQCARGKGIVATPIACPELVEGSRNRSETWGTPNRSSSKISKPVKSNCFWQARFYDFNVWTEKKRIEKLRYIHRNPVERGLVASPEPWKWSSFRWYWRGEVGPLKIYDTDILVMKIRPPAA